MAGQEFNGDVGAVTKSGNVIVCHGGPECPMRRGGIPQSAQDEDDFHRATGIRTGSVRVRELLEELRLRHKLNWRGSKSIEAMWRHRTLEYDDARDCLRLNPSLFALLTGWLYFSLSSVVVLVISAALLLGKGSNTDMVGLINMIAWLIVGAFSMWLTIEHMVLPEAMARRLLNAENSKELADPVGAD